MSAAVPLRCRIMNRLYGEEGGEIVVRVQLWPMRRMAVMSLDAFEALPIGSQFGEEVELPAGSWRWTDEA